MWVPLEEHEAPDVEPNVGGFRMPTALHDRRQGPPGAHGGREDLPGGQL
jgi:hypothetical protein